MQQLAMEEAAWKNPSQRQCARGVSLGLGHTEANGEFSELRASDTQLGTRQGRQQAREGERPALGVPLQGEGQ